MADFIYRIGGTGTSLSEEEILSNVLAIRDVLAGEYGWSLEAVAGALGCFHEESRMNPGIYETSHDGTLDNLPYFKGGMGLAQWTDYPAYTGQYPNPLPYTAEQYGKNWYDGNFQCWLLTQCDNSEITSMGYGQGARWGWQTSPSYPSIPFTEYTTKTDATIRQMVEWWFYCLEWHSSEIAEWVDFEARVQYAEKYYNYMGGTPITPTKKKKKMPVWMMLRY